MVEKKDESTDEVEADKTDEVAKLAAENEDLRKQLAAEKEHEAALREKAAGAPARHPGRSRNFFVGLLVVLACFALVVMGLTWWTHYTVLNTDGYVSLIAPVGKDPEAIKGLSEYVASQVVLVSDLQTRTADALPEKAQFLAAPITSAVNSFIAQQTQKVLSSQQAYDLWIKINTIAHQAIVGLLRGESNYAYITGSDVNLNLLPLVSQALVWIDGKLPDALGSKFSPPVVEPGTPANEAIAQVSAWSGRTLPADFGQVTLLESDALGPAQDAVRWFDALVWIIPIVVLLLIAAAIWLSRHRRRTIIELGVGAAVALILTRVIIRRGSEAILNGSDQSTGFSIVKDVVTASLGPLTTITLWIVVIGVVVAVAAWFSGRHDLQVAVVKAGKHVVSGSRAELAGSSPVVAWIDRHVVLLRWIGLAAGLAILFTAVSAWAGILLTILLVALFEGALSLVTKEWPFKDRAASDATAG